ncbi:alpha-tectorin-like [Pleurodeles waltl]|uniref:alpha-tectorin-like n=1 Tax=Pleurodeles waltl TaxID=8319 RepID=UPI003709982C
MLKMTTLLPMLAVVLAVMLGIGNCVEKCGKNMEYSECHGKCGRTCKDVAMIGDMKMCALACIPGCICKKGYALNSGRCVPEPACGCPANAHYSKCGFLCSPTCGKDNSAPDCAANCMSGCTCNKGYAWSAKAGKCVLPKECPLAPKP